MATRWEDYDALPAAPPDGACAAGTPEDARCAPDVEPYGAAEPGEVSWFSRPGMNRARSGRSERAAAVFVAALLGR